MNQAARALPLELYATSARQQDPKTKLLVVDEKSRTIRHENFGGLARLLKSGDLLVVNDAATIPASFSGVHLESGRAVELRLATTLEPEIHAPRRWLAVLFGDGDWRTPTEQRVAPPSVRLGDVLRFGNELTAHIVRVRPQSNRLIEIEWQGEAAVLWHAIYRQGRLVQYSYLRDELALWDAQSLFATRPVSVEAPSAAFPLSWELFFALKARGVRTASLTHAAGVSNTGDPAVDRLLPFPEHYQIPQQTAALVNETLANGGRIIALGTTVVRALESAYNDNSKQVEAGPGTAAQRLSRQTPVRVISGLISGLHEPGASHLDLLSALIDPRLVETAYAEARERQYLWHEYGDACLLLGGGRQAKLT